MDLTRAPRRHLVIEGDGSLTMYIQELDLAMEEARMARGLYPMDLRISPGTMSDTYAKNFTRAANVAPFMP